MTRRLLVLTAVIVAAAVCLRASTAEERVALQRPLTTLPWNLGEWASAVRRRRERLGQGRAGAASTPEVKERFGREA